MCLACCEVATTPQFGGIVFTNDPARRTLRRVPYNHPTGYRRRMENRYVRVQQPKPSTMRVIAPRVNEFLDPLGAQALRVVLAVSDADINNTMRGWRFETQMYLNALMLTEKQAAHELRAAVFVNGHVLDGSMRNRVPYIPPHQIPWTPAPLLHHSFSHNLVNHRHIQYGLRKNGVIFTQFYSNVVRPEIFYILNPGTTFGYIGRPRRQVIPRPCIITTVPGIPDPVEVVDLLAASDDETTEEDEPTQIQ
jgi:hypothetical protein